MGNRLDGDQIQYVLDAIGRPLGIIDDDEGISVEENISGTLSGRFLFFTAAYVESIILLLLQEFVKIILDYGNINTLKISLVKRIGMTEVKPLCCMVFQL